MNRKYIVISIIFTLFLIPTVFLTFKYSRIYNGYCPSQSRFLTTDEKIDIAINYVIAAYPPVIEKLEHINGINRLKREHPSNYVPYLSLSDFKTINENCCVLTSIAKENYEIPMVDHLLGNTSDFVRINYLVRYFDENHSLISTKIDTYIAISNCGHPWSGI